jgi:DNA-binding transcriptional ArsR family regulator
MGIETNCAARLLPIWPSKRILTPMTKCNDFKMQARVLKVLANESRLRIIDRLNRGECSVGELTDLIGTDVSTVSKHLALLRANGIVDDRRQGTTVFYKLLTPCVCNFFACATQVIKEKSR